MRMTQNHLLVAIYRKDQEKAIQLKIKWEAKELELTQKY